MIAKPTASRTKAAKINPPPYNINHSFVIFGGPPTITKARPIVAASHPLKIVSQNLGFAIFG